MSAFSEAQAYCARAGFRITRDSVDGYSLHDGDGWRHIEYLDDVIEWVDYLCADYEPIHGTGEGV